VFDRLPKKTDELLSSLMLATLETASARGSMASERASPQVVSVEVPAEVLKSLRLPRPRPTLIKEGPKTKKDKKKET